MANDHKIDLEKRDNTTKQGVKQLRRGGKIPGVYYSSTSKTSTPILITKQAYQEAVKSGARIFNISVGSKKQTVLFKSVQYHPVTEEVLHIDLYGVKMDQAVTIKVAVHLIGDAVGVQEDGGVLNQATNEIEIQCLPGDIPEFIETDVSGLHLGDSINAGNIKLDEKFTLITPEDTVLASVTHAMKEVDPVVAVEEDEAFMDEDGEPAEGDAEESANEESTNEKTENPE